MVPVVSVTSGEGQRATDGDTAVLAAAPSHEPLAELPHRTGRGPDRYHVPRGRRAVPARRLGVVRHGHPGLPRLPPPHCAGMGTAAGVLRDDRRAADYRTCRLCVNSWHDLTPCAALALSGGTQSGPPAAGAWSLNDRCWSADVTARRDHPMGCSMINRTWSGGPEFSPWVPDVRPTAAPVGASRRALQRRSGIRPWPGPPLRRAARRTAAGPRRRACSSRPSARRPRCARRGRGHRHAP